MSAGRHPECRERFGTRFERFGGPEAILFTNIVHRSVCHPQSHTAIRYHCVFLQSRVATGFGAVGGAGSIILIAIFLRTDSTIARADLGGPRGQSPRKEQWISIPPKLGEIWRNLATLSDDATSRSDPTSHARIPRMTAVAGQLPQIIIIISVKSIVYLSLIHI